MSRIRAFRHVILAALAAVATAIEPTELLGIEWTVSELGGSAPPAEISLRFEADGTVSGSGGVNRFGGSFTLFEDTLTFGQLRSTMMAGPEPAMRAEQAWHAAIGQPLRIEQVGEQIVLVRDGTRVVLRRKAEQK